MKRSVLLVLAGASYSVHAAGFDCAKAQSKVEHLICDTPELSQLDSSLAAKYKEALRDTPDADVVKRVQMHWLETRNKCRDADCVRQAYLARLSTLASAGSVPSQPASTNSTANVRANGFETEAWRLETVRSLVAQEPSPRPASTNGQYRQVGTSAPACDILLDDLLGGKYKAIEPAQIRAKEDPSPFDQSENKDRSLVQELTGFPTIVTEKLDFCASERAEEKFKGIEGEFFFGFNSMGGPPPYRVYRLRPEVNPYRDANFLYWANYNASNGHGSPYVWVNLDRCAPVFGARANSFDLTAGAPRPIHMHAIAEYRGKFTYVEAEKGSGFSIQHLEPGSIQEGAVQKLGTFCTWTTYPETKK